MTKKNPKTTNPTSTNAGGPRPRPIIRVPARHSQTMNQNLPPASTDEPLPHVGATNDVPPIPDSLDLPVPPRASAPLQSTTAVNSNPPATSAAAESDTTLAAKYANALAEIDRLTKANSVATSEAEVKRPEGRVLDLQHAMGLDDDRALYMSCRATVRDVMGLADLPVGTSWHKQEPLVLAKITALAKARNPQLGRYEHGWATLEIIRTINKNKRSYNKKIGRSSSTKGAVDDNGGREGSNELDDDVPSGGEEVTNGTGKRRKVTHGGTSKRVMT